MGSMLNRNRYMSLSISHEPVEAHCLIPDSTPSPCSFRFRSAARSSQWEKHWTFDGLTFISSQARLPSALANTRSLRNVSGDWDTKARWATHVLVVTRAQPAAIVAVQSATHRTRGTASAPSEVPPIAVARQLDLAQAADAL